MTDEQLAALYPTVQSYVDKIVAKTLANAAAGYIPRGLHARSRVVHGHPRRRQRQRRADRQRRRRPAARERRCAPRSTARAGDKYLAMLDLDLIADLASHSIANAAARDAVLRPTKAASALLWEAIDAPTSTTVSGGVGGTVPATLSISLGAPAAFGAFTPGVARDYDATSTVTTTSSARRRDADDRRPERDHHGRLVNGRPLAAAGAAGRGHRRVRAARRLGEPDAAEDVGRADRQRGGHGQVPPVDRGQRRAADRRLQQDRDVHALDHDAVELTASALAPRRRGAGAGGTRSQRRMRAVNPTGARRNSMSQVS